MQTVTVPHNYQPPHSPRTPRHYRRRYQIPSSDPVEELDDPTLFPRVAEWLQELDQGPRGADGHNFTQHGARLEQNMFMRIFQLETLMEEKLVAVCESMAPGTATLIMQYARKDCSRIRKNEAQRLREARLQPKRYL